MKSLDARTTMVKAITSHTRGLDRGQVSRGTAPGTLGENNMKTHDERMTRYTERRAELKEQSSARKAKIRGRLDELKQERQASHNAFETERAKYLEAKLDAQSNDERGAGDQQIMCPHCRSMGLVTTKSVRIKTRGVSRGRVATAVVLSPLSLFFTGLSRTRQATQATCANCHVTWIIQ